MIPAVSASKTEYAGQNRTIDVADRAGGQSRKFLLKLPYAALQYYIAAIDAALIIFASAIGGSGYQYFANGTFGDAGSLLGVGVISALLYGLICKSAEFYDLEVFLSKRRVLARIAAYWGLVCLSLALFAFLMKIGPAFSRGSIICFELLALSLLSVGRVASKQLIKSAVADRRLEGRRAVLLGTREELAALDLNELLARFGLTEVGSITFLGEKSANLAMSEIERSSLDEAISLARDKAVDEIVLALPWNETRKIELVRDFLRSSPLPIRLLPDRRIRSLTGNPSFQLRKSLSIEIQRGPLTRVEQMLKRTVDIIGASIGLFLLSPIMIMSAIAVKLDSTGSILFRQRRNGFNTKQFVIFKFRTMSVMEDGESIVQAKRSDPRVTKVGGLLRRSSIDELPQLLNVLRGDMSLVGPRPHALAHDNYYSDLLSEYAFRHHVKPGITGWAQIKGFRGETARVEQMKGRLDCDLWYINNWTLLLDLKVLAMTCFELVRRRNAY